MHEYLYLLELNQRDIGLPQKEGCPLDVVAAVIHNGAKPWSAPTARFGPLLGPPTEAGRELNQWRSYVVIDYPTLAGDHALMRRLLPDNRQAALIRLESASSDELPKLLTRNAPAVERAGVRGAAPGASTHGRSTCCGGGDWRCRRWRITNGCWRQEKGAREMTTLMEARLQEWHDNAIAQGVRQGVRQGVQQGQADLLRRLAQRRFDGETARRLSALLEDADADRLIEVGDWIVECGSGDELLERLRQASGLV